MAEIWGRYRGDIGEEREGGVGLLERAHVVAAVAAHEHLAPRALLQLADHLREI